MYSKEIVPIQILNAYATEFICELPLVFGDFSKRQFEIEFYDKYGHALLMQHGEICGLPVNDKLVGNVMNPYNFNYKSPEAEAMFIEQDKFIIDRFRTQFGLTYYDDTYKTRCYRRFNLKSSSA